MFKKSLIIFLTFLFRCLNYKPRIWYNKFQKGIFLSISHLLRMLTIAAVYLAFRTYYGMKKNL